MHKPFSEKIRERRTVGMPDHIRYRSHNLATGRLLPRVEIGRPLSLWERGIDSATYKAIASGKCDPYEMSD